MTSHATPRADGAAPDPIAELAAEAVGIVTGARRGQYGTPERNFAAIAGAWTWYLTTRGHAVALTAADVAAMMRLFKEARLATGDPRHRDSHVDLIGYALAGAEVAGVFAAPLTVMEDEAGEPTAAAATGATPWPTADTPPLTRDGADRLRRRMDSQGGAVPVRRTVAGGGRWRITHADQGLWALTTRAVAVGPLVALRCTGAGWVWGLARGLPIEWLSGGECISDSDLSDIVEIIDPPADVEVAS